MTDITTISDDIICLCKTPNTALSAIHLLWQHGRANQAAFSALYERVMCDKDAQAAYYLAVFALQSDDLPYDGAPLIRLIMQSDDEQLKQKLLKKLPIDAIQAM